MTEFEILEDLIPLQCIGHKETVDYKEAMEKDWLICLECYSFICQECARECKKEMMGRCPNGFFEEHRTHELKPFPIAPRSILKTINLACERRKQQLAPLAVHIESAHQELDETWDILSTMTTILSKLSQSIEWILQFLMRKPSPLDILEQQASILRLQLQQQQAVTAMETFPFLDEMHAALAGIDGKIQHMKNTLKMVLDLTDETSQEILQSHLERLESLKETLHVIKEMLISLYRDLKRIKREIVGREEKNDKQLTQAVHVFLQMILERSLMNARISTKRIEPFVQLNKALSIYLPQLLVGGADLEHYRHAIEEQIQHIRKKSREIRDETRRVASYLRKLLESSSYSEQLAPAVKESLEQLINQINDSNTNYSTPKREKKPNTPTKSHHFLQEK